VHGPLLNLVVDYAELVPMDTDDERLSRDRQVSSIFRNGLGCAHDTGAAVHVLSQYNKTPSYSKHKIASPDALRYGAGGWHAADVVLQVWNPMQMKASQIDYSIPPGMTDDQVWLIITKYKEGPSGNIFPLDWTSSYTRFSDPMLDGTYGADLYMHMAALADDF
jgi:replicative DNA helicase